MSTAAPNPFSSFSPTLSGPPRLGPTDVSYVVEDTAVGRLLVAVRDDARVVICAYVPDDAAEDRWLRRLASSVSPRVLRHPGATDAARRALESYLAGRSRSVDVTPDLVLATSFQREVLGGLARRVGYGERTTYSELARAVDHEGAARAVGNAL